MPGSVTPHTKFTSGCMYCLKMKVVVTRHSSLPSPVLLPYHRRDWCSGASGTEMVMPGDNVQMEVTLIHPIAMEGVFACYSKVAVPSVRVLLPDHRISKKD